MIPVGLLGSLENLLNDLFDQHCVTEGANEGLLAGVVEAQDLVTAVLTLPNGPPAYRRQLLLRQVGRTWSTPPVSRRIESKVWASPRSTTQATTKALGVSSRRVPHLKRAPVMRFS